MPECPFCNKEFDPRGLRLHIIFCKKKNNPDVQGPIQAERNREVDNHPDTSTTEGAHPNTTPGTQIDQLPDANDIQVSQELAIQGEPQNIDSDSIVEQRVDQHTSKILEDVGEGGTPPNDVDVQIELEEKLKDLTNDIEKLKEKLHDEEEEVIELDQEEVQEAVERAMGRKIAPLLQKMDERDEKLKSWSKERDQQMGAHINDMKRSVDAQNARVAQCGHKIDDLAARFVKKASPESTPPDQSPPETPPAPVEESEPASAKNELPVGVCEGDEKHWFDEGEQAGGLKTCPVDKTAINWNLFYGQCAGKNPHLMEKGEAQQHPKFCTECGAKVVWYPSPKKLKTKKEQESK